MLAAVSAGIPVGTCNIPTDNCGGLAVANGGSGGGGNGVPYCMGGQLHVQKQGSGSGQLNIWRATLSWDRDNP